MDIALVRAANSTREKKQSPIQPPATPNDANTLGSVTNIRFGPASIAALPPSPAAKIATTGIIMNPAITATNVSAATILTDAFVTESHRRM